MIAAVLKSRGCYKYRYESDTMAPGIVIAVVLNQEVVHKHRIGNETHRTADSIIRSFIGTSDRTTIAAACKMVVHKYRIGTRR